MGTLRTAALRLADRLRGRPRTGSSTVSLPRRLMLAVGLAATLAAPLGAGTPATALASSRPRALPQLANEAERQPDRTFRVIVTRQTRDKTPDERVAKKGGRKLKEVAGDAFVAELKGKEIADLGKQSSVKWITYDAPMIKTAAVDATRLATLYDQTVNATALWGGEGPSQVTGKGIGIAVIDTGINDTLDDFRQITTASSRVVERVKFNDRVNTVQDGHGHGTHVAGIIAGDSWRSEDEALRGKYVGIAPRASLINVRASDDVGMAYMSDIVNALDWVVANRQAYNIRVVNLSMVSSIAESYKTSMLAAAAERAWFNGVFVVVAAGNTGPDTLLYPPANDPFVVTVGASDTMGTVSRADDGMAPWSSYGVSQDGVSKPDVVAPGRSIVSTLAGPTVTLATQFPDRLIDGNYIRLSGTSMATPVVAGIAALAFEKHPEWTNDQLKSVLAGTAQKLGGGVLPGQGAGLVDAAAVVNYSGSPQAANQGLAISELLSGPGGASTYTSATSSPSSWSTSSWSASSWSTSSWSTSSWSTSSWSTSSWSTSSWSTSSWSTSSWASSFRLD